LIPFSIIPSFLDLPEGRIFYVSHIPSSSSVSAGVVLVPPFAEEMNKSRRMLSLIAKALAGRGMHVVLPDFFGTGDSEGDFSEASWEGWLEQLDQIINKMVMDYDIESYSLLGVRAGSLLAIEHIQQPQADADKLILWQPVIDGAAYLTQFLRLRLASGILRGDEEKETTQSLKQRLNAGETVEVAGYGLTSAVADGLAASSLKNVDCASLPSTCWIDIVSKDGQASPLVNRKLAQEWREAGVTLQHLNCVGEPFWASVEIAEVRGMIDESVDFLSGGTGVA